MKLRVVPLHAHFDQARLESVVEIMKSRGAPEIRAWYDEPADTWFAREGTHRLRACQILGCAPVLRKVSGPSNENRLCRARKFAQRHAHVFEGK